MWEDRAAARVRTDTRQAVTGRTTERDEVWPRVTASAVHCALAVPAQVADAGAILLFFRD